MNAAVLGGDSRDSIQHTGVRQPVRRSVRTPAGKHSSQAGFNVEDVMNMKNLKKSSKRRSRKPDGDRDRSA